MSRILLVIKSKTAAFYFNFEIKKNRIISEYSSIYMLQNIDKVHVIIEYYFLFNFTGYIWNFCGWKFKNDEVYYRK